ncbi:hypothetical protein [Pantoea sp. Marseille-Q5743]|nr:hypothetical protein [Pantoea sp. Marseille-Q5743]
MDRRVVTVNLSHWSRLNTGTLKHTLRHVMSKALYRCIPTEAPESFTVM